MHNNLRIGIIGAGSMGAGIAQVAACAGHPVVLIDNRLEAAEKALRTMAKDLAGAVTRQRMTAAEADQAVARVRIGAQLADLRDADLVIEAAVEQLPVKQKILGELEQHVSPQAILATNTSSLSITAVAQGLQHPERLAGLHFFNPATRMKLVEVIGGVATRPDVLVTLHELARAWGKTTVDAPDAPGFIVNRVARPYYAEIGRAHV